MTAWEEVEIDGQRYFRFEGTVRGVGSAWSHNEDDAAFIVQHMPAMPGRPWVNPHYGREVRDDGGITYRRRDGDIIDRIDELVDEQMAGGEPRQGYDFNDPTYPRCPHCERHWHGLAITERVAEMYSRGHFDESYRVGEDDSRVLCEGSGFIGPVRPEAEMGSTGWLTRLHRGAAETPLGRGYRYQGFGMRAGFRIDHLEIDGVTVTIGESAEDVSDRVNAGIDELNTRRHATADE